MSAGSGAATGKATLFAARDAPNPRRVLVAAAELGLEQALEVRWIALRDTKSAAMLRRNPEGQVPVLETISGLCISESVAITRWLEETHNGTQPGGARPSLFGADADSRALVEQWNRRVDIALFMSGVGRVWLHNPLLAGLAAKSGLKQTQAERQFGQSIASRQFKILDAQLKHTGAFLAGDSVSVADISLVCCLDFATGLAGVALSGSSFPHLAAWRERMAQRPAVLKHPNPYGAKFFPLRGADTVLSAARRVSTALKGGEPDDPPVASAGEPATSRL
jgi:glutathione S-transferase